MKQFLLEMDDDTFKDIRKWLRSQEVTGLSNAEIIKEMFSQYGGYHGDDLDVSDRVIVKEVKQ